MGGADRSSDARGASRQGDIAQGVTQPVDPANVFLKDQWPLHEAGDGDLDPGPAQPMPWCSLTKSPSCSPRRTWDNIVERRTRKLTSTPSTLPEVPSETGLVQRPYPTKLPEVTKQPRTQEQRISRTSLRTGGRRKIGAALLSQHVGHQCRPPTRHRQLHLSLHEDSRPPAVLTFLKRRPDCHRCSVLAVCTLADATVFLVGLNPPPRPHPCLQDPASRSTTSGPPLGWSVPGSRRLLGLASGRETLDGARAAEPLGLSWPNNRVFRA